MNIFRFIADMLHLAAILTLLYRIKVVRNCIGKWRRSKLWELYAMQIPVFWLYGCRCEGAQFPGLSARQSGLSAIFHKSSSQLIHRTAFVSNCISVLNCMFDRIIFWDIFWRSNLRALSHSDLTGFAYYYFRPFMQVAGDLPDRLPCALLGPLHVLRQRL